MVYIGFWSHGWRSEECRWKWLQSGECDVCEYSWSWVSFLAVFFFSTLDFDPFFTSHMVPLNQPEAALVCLLSFSILPSNLSCLVSPLSASIPSFFFFLSVQVTSSTSACSLLQTTGALLSKLPCLCVFFFFRIWSLDGSWICLCCLNRVRLLRPWWILFLHVKSIIGDDMSMLFLGCAIVYLNLLRARGHGAYEEGVAQSFMLVTFLN